jgi:hypothetical protein
VLGSLFDALDLIEIKLGIFLDLFQSRLGDLSHVTHRFTGQNLNLQHNLEFVLL